MSDENKLTLSEVKDVIAQGTEKIESKFENANEAAKEKMTDELDELKKEIEAKEYATTEDLKKEVDEMSAKFQKAQLERKKEAVTNRSFKEDLQAGMAGSIEGLKALKNGGGSKVVADLKATKAEALEDLNESDFTNNAYTFATADNRGLRGDANDNRLWLRNLLPNGTTNGGVIHYSAENGWEGAAGVWDGSGNIDTLTAKPGLSPLFDGKTKTVDWIAGITRVKREMLDDIGWLRGYLSRKLLTGKQGLFVAENTQIANELDTNSTAYNGTLTEAIEIAYDAAFGQLGDNRYAASFILMNNRDVVSQIALHKASGSGEYDLPPGTVAILNGQLSIGGVPVIGTPDVTSGEMYVVDASETEFITRMSPEVEFFREDRDNVPKNLVTVRAEERIAALVYDSAAVIKGTFSTT